MRKISLLLSLCLLLTPLLASCRLDAEHAEDAPKGQQYTATFLDLFDTVTTVIGYAESEEAFEEIVQPIRDELERYHRLFDIYKVYTGLTNLRIVNDKAGVAPVKVDASVIALLEDCKSYYKETGGVFNPAMGSVLRLWHDARENGINDPSHAALPNADALREAAKHTNPDHIILDKESSTVFFSDPKLKLDVGAIAKGWATERVAKNAPAGLLISVGGNVCTTGPKTEAGMPWTIGIRNPFGEGNLLVLNVKDGCVVTSGSYQRAFTVDGKAYHYIIDPATLYPGTKWVSVSVVCEDSGLADVLSTSLFLMEREDGLKLLEKYGAHALWVDANGNKYNSPGFRDLIRN